MEHINFSRADFFKSTPDLQGLPPDKGSEVAFAGRSNAGKSSSLNALTNNAKLARTSKTPGRTRDLVFFSLGSNKYLVDLPGYGFAKAPEKVRKKWEETFTAYMSTRDSLKGIVLLMDIRHPLNEFDKKMIEWASSNTLPLHILLTKADKLKRGAAQNTLLTVKRKLLIFGNISIQTFSSLKKQGLKELKQKLNEWYGGIY